MKFHSWSVEGSFERSFVHTCIGALNCSSPASLKSCVSPWKGRVHLNSDWINSSMSFRVSSQSESNCMELIWKARSCELLWDLWDGVSRMYQLCRSSVWSSNCATFWEEFIPSAFVQRLVVGCWGSSDPPRWVLFRKLPWPLMYDQKSLSCAGAAIVNNYVCWIARL